MAAETAAARGPGLLRDLPRCRSAEIKAVRKARARVEVRVKDKVVGKGRPQAGREPVLKRLSPVVNPREAGPDRAADREGHWPRAGAEEAKGPVPVVGKGPVLPVAVARDPKWRQSAAGEARGLDLPDQDRGKELQLLHPAVGRAGDQANLLLRVLAQAARRHSLGWVAPDGWAPSRR